jgi:cellulose synthase/poly-beta-1,6-N-acetylglucosamine synthase-like glycosyltransferase
MLEFVSFILSCILFAYGVRMVIFLWVAWKYHSKSIQILHHSPAVSTLKSPERSNVRSVNTFHENVILYDSLRFSSLEKKEQLSNSRNGERSTQFEPGLSRFSNYESDPVISIIIATNNEEGVVARLLSSLETLNYDSDRFEIIVVDDSTDSTLKILEQWTNRLKNLKIIRRSQRIGNKGGALNLALESLRKDSSWVIIIDADTILPPDTIERFLYFTNGCEGSCEAIQGYCIPYNKYIGEANWVSRGVEFRLAQRNMIEFVAKNKLHLTVQITGSLFMIKTSLIRQIGFSTDICEDWDLTLNLYFREQDSNQHNTNILFDETLNALNQAPVSFLSYFSQRLRVSEGHTRGFIKKIPRLFLQKRPLKNKIEIFFTGFRYLRYLLILSVLLLDFSGLFLTGPIKLNMFFMMSFALQLLCIGIFVLVNGLTLVICRRSFHYTLNFLTSELIVEFFVSPALMIGSLLGIFRKSGSFHRTHRIRGLLKESV